MSAGPLAGCGVLLTRPAGQSDNLSAAIKSAGGKVFRFPAMDIDGRDIDEVRRDFAELAEPDIIVFVSSNAVAHGIAAVSEANAQIAAIGPATRSAIEATGNSVDIFPEGAFDSERLLRHSALVDVNDKNVVIVRGQSGRELLADTLRARGACVDYLHVYRRDPHQPTAAEIESLEWQLHHGEIHFVTVMSVETMDCLVRIVPPQPLGLLQRSVLVAPSTRVLQTASELLPGVSAVLAPGPEAPAIVDTLIRQWQSGQIS